MLCGGGYSFSRVQSKDHPSWSNGSISYHPSLVRIVVKILSFLQICLFTAVIEVQVISQKNSLRLLKHTHIHVRIIQSLLFIFPSVNNFCRQVTSSTICLFVINACGWSTPFCLKLNEGFFCKRVKEPAKKMRWRGILVLSPFLLRNIENDSFSPQFKYTDSLEALMHIYYWKKIFLVLVILENKEKAFGIYTISSFCTSFSQILLKSFVFSLTPGSKYSLNIVRGNEI